MWWQSHCYSPGKPFCQVVCHSVIARLSRLAEMMSLLSLVTRCNMTWLKIYCMGKLLLRQVTRSSRWSGNRKTGGGIVWGLSELSLLNLLDLCLALATTVSHAVSGLSSRQTVWTRPSVTIYCTKMSSTLTTKWMLFSPSSLCRWELPLTPGHEKILCRAWENVYFLGSIFSCRVTPFSSHLPKVQRKFWQSQLMALFPKEHFLKQGPPLMLRLQPTCGNKTPKCLLTCCSCSCNMGFSHPEMNVHRRLAMDNLVGLN